MYPIRVIGKYVVTMDSDALFLCQKGDDDELIILGELRKDNYLEFSLMSEEQIDGMILYPKYFKGSDESE